MEALRVAVLPGRARLNVERADAQLLQPSADRLAVNSGPLSLWMCSGTPRITSNSAQVSITSSPKQPPSGIRCCLLLLLAAPVFASFLFPLVVD